MPSKYANETLWRGLRQHLNWNTDEIAGHRARSIWISTFSSKENAAKWALDFKRERYGYELRLMTIDTSKFDCKAYHAATMIRELDIPLKKGLQCSDFENEYLILDSIPGESFTRYEIFPDIIDPSNLLSGLTVSDTLMWTFKPCECRNFRRDNKGVAHTIHDKNCLRCEPDGRGKVQPDPIA